MESNISGSSIYCFKSTARTLFEFTTKWGAHKNNEMHHDVAAGVLVGMY